MAHVLDQTVSLPGSGAGRRRAATAEASRDLFGDVDRSPAFRAARRHTFLVRSLRILLPIATLGMCGVYVASAMRGYDWAGGLGQLPLPRITAESLVMANPRYEGFGGDGGKYVVAARSAQQDFQQPTVVKLEGITGELTDARKARTVMTGTRGVFDTRSNVLQLLDGIDIAGDQGMRAKLSSAVVLTKKSVILSREPVEVSMTTGNIAAQRMLMWQRRRAVLFSGGVRTLLRPPAGEAGVTGATGARSVAAASAAPSASALFGGSGGPVEIRSYQLRVRDTEQSAVFSGRVRAEQEGQVLETQRLEVYYRRGEDATGGVPGASGGAIDRIMIPRPLVITRSTGEEIRGEAARFDVADETAEIVGNVIVSAGPDRRATGDRASFDSRSDTATLEGDVIVSQGGNTLAGRRLYMDRAGGTMRLHSPGGDGAKPGRIAARFVREDPAAKPGAPPATGAKPAETAGANPLQGLSVAAFQTDSTAPIDVDAAVLDVDDNSRTATFSGDVKVSQGAFTLRTSNLVAHYSGTATLAAASGDAGPSGAGDGDAAAGGTELKRLQAKGKVLVGSPSGQRASGDWANLDMERNIVEIGGDVVLTQGQNVIRGTRLKIDMTSGHTVIETAPEAASDGWAMTVTDPVRGQAKVAVPSGIGARGGRPSAVFFPSQLKDGKSEAGSAKSPAAETGKASGWSATTEPPRRSPPASTAPARGAAPATRQGGWQAEEDSGGGGVR